MARYVICKLFRCIDVLSRVLLPCASINLAQLLHNRTVYLTSYLHKQSGGAFKSWQKRYCVLHDEPAMLIYALNTKGKTVKNEGANNAAKGT